MPQGTVAYAIEELRSRGGTSSTRYVDLCVIWRLDDGREVLRVGGVWDRRLDAWSVDREPRHARVLRFSPAQQRAVTWLARWFRAYLAGDWAGFERAWSALLYGGRRSGKTWLLSAALVTFAIARPGCTVLAVCPSQDAADEVHDRVTEFLDSSWYQLYEDEHRYVTVHGSTLKLSGAGLRSAGKQGQIDLAAINEAQLCKGKIYTNLRGAIVDSGGLVIMAANPPEDLERAGWLEEHWQECRDRKRAGVEFFIDNAANPHINQAALSALQHELDPLTYDREVRGKMGLPPPDAVFYTWADADHYTPVPPDWLDCTRELTVELLHQPYDDVLGHDFDLRPYLACSRLRAYRPVSSGLDAARWWVIDAIIRRGDEELIIDILRERNIDPATTIIVADASGAWQDVERNKGSASFDYYKHHGYRIVRPDHKHNKNPLRGERERATNTLLRSSAGEIRLHIAPPGSVLPDGIVAGEECALVAEALRRWPRNETGTASKKKSKYAHICDSVSYPVWRLYGRKLPKQKLPGKGRPKGSGGGAMRVKPKR